MKYNATKAYLLWLIGGFGAFGLHRFYLGKFGSGVVWFCTGGLGMMGSIYDFFTLRRQVEDANIRDSLKNAMESGTFDELRRSVAATQDSIEKAILRAAKRNEGLVTPGEVALDSNYSVDQVRAALEKMATEGNAEMMIRQSGIIVFRFPEFVKELRDDFIS
ncbi:MAG: TM2 domain-containing protein [Spirochaetes bacterium]|nr:TM2 domain-containing protein [Spirochaetota bacterium]